MMPPAAVLLAVLIFSPGYSSGSERGILPAGRNIRIMVLSKNVRELKEGRRQSIVLDLPAGACAETETGIFFLRQISARFSGGRFIVAGGGSEFSSRTVITGEGADSLFTFTAGGETRRYPLPLEINVNGSDLQFIVTEDIMQYAVDSASAELGVYDESKEEALYALAHAVLARSLCAAEGTRHVRSHFCDLTCCQGYRGRSRFTFADPVTIDAGCGSRIFFGSSGGGVILTGRVFSVGTGISEQPLPDTIFSDNFTLSRELYPSWKAEINIDELNSILYPAIKKRVRQIEYSVQHESMTLDTCEGPHCIAPETFRLIINRVKGWSFIKSNNYGVRLENGVFVFRGSGLGHCAGMSIEGAVQLARKGYSRYEILEHYYPWIKYHSREGAEAYHYHRFVTFDLQSGRATGGTAAEIFSARRIPAGSVSKLITVLYLASERRDLFYNYRFRCRADNSGRNIPEKCWETAGHGDMDLRSAIYNSCNIYFASLCSEIDMKRYVEWVHGFAGDTGIDIDFPAVKTEREFALLLAGLDFRCTISVRGLMRLAMLVSPVEPADSMLSAFRKKKGSDEYSIIREALCMTMTLGTGSHGSGNGIKKEGRGLVPVWGKTGTVISGTNSHCGYGIFIGGSGRCGIVSILRRGTGSMAADYSARVLARVAGTQYTLL